MEMKRPHLAATGVGWEGAPRFMQVCFSVLPRQARSLEGRDPASSNCAQVGLLVSKMGGPVADCYKQQEPTKAWIKRPGAKDLGRGQ